MEELTIEQKAKAYDEAIKRAQAKIEEAKVFDYDDEQTAHTIRLTTTDIFPELKESEGEKTRKMVLKAFKLFAEKQAWVGHCLDDIDWDKCIAWLENQGEQKSAWSEEDELHIKKLESLVKQVWAIAEHENDKDTIQKMSDLSFFLKTLKPQLKQEWSDEDIKTMRQIFRIVKDSGCSNRCYERIAKFLNNITPNPQKQWKPSEEDKKMLDFAIMAVGLCKQYAINHQVNGYSSLPDVPKRYEELQDWLKSLKDRYTWKPSDEQFKLLKHIMENVPLSYIDKSEVGELYLDLKKLRRE